MADVYKFKVKLNDFEDIIWRDIEITSVLSVAKLGYSVLAGFEAKEHHLFAIKFNTNRYEILFEDQGYTDKPVIDPINTKLSSLKLKVNDKLTMDYDYGAGWQFSIELISITPMKKGAGTHYPYVTDGMGRGIIEDYFPPQLSDIISKTDKEGIIPKIFDPMSEREFDWDYRGFDLKYCNTFLKDYVAAAQSAYEDYE